MHANLFAMEPDRWSRIIGKAHIAKTESAMSKELLLELAFGAIAWLLLAGVPLASAQSLQVAPAVFEILTTHPAFKEFPTPRISHLASTMQYTHTPGDEATPILITTTYKLLPNRLLESRSDSQSSSSQSHSTFRAVELNLGVWAVVQSSHTIRFSNRKEEEHEGRHAVTSIRSVEGSLFPVREGARLAYQLDIVRKTEIREVGTEKSSRIDAQENSSIVMEVLRRVEASSVLPQVPGAAWEVRRTDTTVNKHGQRKIVDYYVYLEELGALVPIRQEGTFNNKSNWSSRTVADEIGWRDDSGVEHLVSRAGGRTVVAATGMVAAAPSAESGERARQMFFQGFKYFQSGVYDDAVVQFRDGLALDPDNAQGHFFLAETYVRLGRRVPAREHYEQAVRLAPSSPEGAQAKAALEKMR